MKKYIYTLLFLAQIFPLVLLGQTSVMSYNIRYDNPSDNENSWENRKSEVAGLIEYYHPDFLGIQEGLYKQVDFIQKNTSNYKYIGVGRDGGKKGEYSAIYYDTTKFELIAQNTFWLSNRPNKISIGWNAALPRICTYGKFKNKLTNDSIHIFNTHFDHIGVKARKKAAKLILKKIIEYKLNNANVIVMGDLNSTPMSEPVAIFSKKLDYGFKNSLKKFYGPLGTFNGFNNCLEIKKRIDYIFTKNITVLSYRHIDDKRVNNLCISDHIPVLVEIKNTTANNVYN